jgi:subtilisin family serine protease
MIRKCMLAVAVSLSLSAAAHAADLRKVANPIPGQYIVVFKPDAVRSEFAKAPVAQAQAFESPEAQLAAASEHAAVDLAARHNLNVGRTFGHAVQGMMFRTKNALSLKRLLADPRVAFVEEDGYVQLDATQSGATWGLDRSDQRALPLNGTYVYNSTGSGVRAYVIDSGILSSHSEFSGRMLSGYTAIADGRGTTDCNGHGTHVAGTIGGTTWGIAKSVRLVPVRVFGCSGGSANSTIIAGIDWVRQNRVLPAVANMSLGGGASSATDTATNNLINSGVVVVVAAGNSNANACNYSPARTAAAITVGSTASNDSRSSFSNYGSCLDIFAPGSSIRSAWYTSTTASNTISGTSMASPHVAGAAAKYLSTSPSASPATVRNALVNGGTTNVVSGAGTGSPNRLLYTR